MIVMKKSHLAVFFFGMFAASPIWSDTPPPDWPIDTLPSACATKDPAKGLNLGAFRVNLEETEFKDLSGLPPARIQQQGDASESLKWVCYTLQNPLQRLWLASSEMGGGRYIDLAVLAETFPSDSSNIDCPELPKQFQPVLFDNGIGMGVAMSGVQKTLGKPKWVQNTAHYCHEAIRGEWQVYGSLRLRVRNGKIVSIFASRGTSN